MKGLFFGSKRLGLAVLQCICHREPQIGWHIVHPADFDDPRGTVAEFEYFAKQNNFEISNVRSQVEARKVINSVKPDIIFVCGWYWLFSESDLKVPSYGVWGIHNSLLPKYRGGSPLVWSLINGDPVVGTSIFRVSEGVDSGPILHQIEIVVNPSSTVGIVLREIEQRLVNELPQKWSALLAGNAVLTEQDHSKATYCGQRYEYDGRINWARCAKEVHNFVKAQSDPYPGSFCFLGEKKLQLIDTKTYDGTFYGTPGQVLRISDESVLISCGESTALEVFSVKLNGVFFASPKVVTSMKVRLD